MSAILALKVQPGRKLQVIGSGNLIQTLHAASLIDEYNVWTTTDTHERSQLWDLIKDIKFEMFTTLHQNGHLHSQPMTTRNQLVDEDDRLWFFMSHSSGPVSDLLIDGNVNVCFADPVSHNYVSVSDESTVRGTVSSTGARSDAARGQRKRANLRVARKPEPRATNRTTLRRWRPAKRPASLHRSASMSA